MTTKTTRDPSVIWAEKLWERLATNLFDAQNAIIAIIQAKAWEPLGYESFEKAWVDKMSSFTLAVELQPLVIYQLLSEGLTADQVAEAVKGVGLDIVEHLKAQRDDGVPADHASRRPRRKASTRPWTTIFVHVGEAALEGYESKAAAHGVKVEDVAREAIASAFEAL